MTISTISTFPVAPQRSNDPETFNTRADPFFAHFNTYDDEINTTIGEMNTAVINVSNDRAAAEAAASDAQNAEASANAAANFKGLWSSLTGSLSTPASVKHNGEFWELLNNLADVTTSEPGISGDWTSKTTLTGDATGAIDMAGNALTVDAVYSDQTDKGTQSTGGATVTFDISAASSQKLTIAANTTVAFSNWPASGTESGVEIELVNGGSAAITWPTINWYVGDGATSTTFADTGVTLASSGTNVLTVWSSDGGTTLYGVAV